MTPLPYEGLARNHTVICTVSVGRPNYYRGLVSMAELKNHSDTYTISRWRDLEEPKRVWLATAYGSFGLLAALGDARKMVGNICCHTLPAQGEEGGKGDRLLI